MGLAETFEQYGVPDARPYSKPSGDGTSRIERVTNKLAAAIESKVSAFADNLTAQSERPPFSVKLSAQEQLQQWAAMDEQKWTKFVLTYGLDKAKMYSDDMLKLYAETYGPIEGATVVAPAQTFGQQATPAGQSVPSSGGAPTSGTTQSVDDIINEAMTSAAPR